MFGFGGGSFGSGMGNSGLGSISTFGMMGAMGGGRSRHGANDTRRNIMAMGLANDMIRFSTAPITGTFGSSYDDYSTRTHSHPITGNHRHYRHHGDHNTRTPFYHVTDNHIHDGDYSTPTMKSENTVHSTVNHNPDVTISDEKPPSYNEVVNAPKEPEQRKKKKRNIFKKIWRFLQGKNTDKNW